MAKVTIDQGTLIGKKCKTENEYEYFEFLEIPYAKPPLGNLRFKNPQPPESWEGERYATTTKLDHVSLQFDLISKTTRGSEDCLYLNVYTPVLPADNSKPIPVMVYIHGGGFVCGSGTYKTESGPEFLLENDVIIVAINYRLTVFGFLSLDIPEAAGNMGLKDQVMALKWVQNNIGHFGGDKHNVTLFGISAGGASIEYLILSPLSADLFHRAILQSGSTLNHWTINYNIKELTIKLALELGYQGPSNDVAQIYNFLLEQPTKSLSDVAFTVSNINTAKGTYFGFVPSIEKDFGNGEAFLTEYPYNLLKEGRFNKVSVIRGFCEYEGFLLKGLKPVDVLELMENQRFLDFWTYPLDSDDIDKYNRKFKKVYIEENGVGDDDDKPIIDFIGDFDFTSGILISAKLMAENGVSVHTYMFAYDGSLNVIKMIFGIKAKGACHGDDTNYTISSFSPPGTANPNKTDLLIRQRINKMWTDFAKSGNPVPNTSDLIPIRWPTYNNDNLNYLVIDKELEIRSNYQPNRIAIFEEIYEKYLK
uniref:Carboxylic ester hydrolase n=1 Tax=Streltzoviella insularis TaxID=1206366 RepID=A0A7D5YYE4_9NEOP|nr:carboxylesterase 18 [Streltzoviella insularis]